MVVIRALAADDHDAVLALADRLTEGVAAWRAPELVLEAVRSWVMEDLAREGDDRMMYVAADDSGVVGVVSVAESAHWTGEVDAYIGELVVDPRCEKRGVGTKLVRQAERWATARGLARIRLSTGAANAAALGLYAGLGYHAEDVTLSKAVTPQLNGPGSVARRGR